MLLNIAKVLIVYICVSQSIFSVAPEENNIAEIFRKHFEKRPKYIPRG